jgi:AcrR family transcriptional regulator
MLVAMLHATADRGYVAATVADVVARASVSRSTFYGHFADKEACFVAAYEFAMDHVIEEMQIANRSLPPAQRSDHLPQCARRRSCPRHEPAR